MRIKFFILNVLLNSGARIFSEGGGRILTMVRGGGFFPKGADFPAGLVCRLWTKNLTVIV